MGTLERHANIGYAKYEEIDKEQLQKDIEEARDKLGKPTYEDFKHLLKLERWGRVATFGGFAIVATISYIEVTSSLSSFTFWFFAIVAAVLIGVGNTSRWANVVHPILHGAYDKVEGIPKKYTKPYFAKNHRRYLDWLDWIKPEAWEYEHNIMHHYHLGELDDPDNVENNVKWLTESKIPMPIRYIIMYLFAGTWKFTYYAPNTLKILENKEARKRGEEEMAHQVWNPKKDRGIKLWMDYLLPYIIVKFIAIPALFIPLGTQAVFNAFIVVVLAEIITNLHSFLVIVPNHSAEDIYMFNEPHKNTGEFYLRQIMGSVNYNTGSDFKDFLHGFLNYQIEHHLFPNQPHSFYQKLQPIVKDICKKHNLEYRQESVFKRVKMSMELMVGQTKPLRVDGV